MSAFGPHLLKTTSLQALIAYQYPISSRLTQRFNAALYTALAEGTPLELASQLARKKVWASDSEGPAFLSPAVFVRNPGGLPLIGEAHRAAAYSRSRVGALSGRG